MMVRIINQNSAAYGRTFEAERTLTGYRVLGTSSFWTGTEFSTNEVEEV